MKCDNQLTHKLDRPFPDGEGNIIYSIPLNCGKCYNCKANRASMWSFRLAKEQEVSDSSYFITLTYHTEHIPYTDKGGTTLKKKDLQDFFKRLRYYEAQSNTLSLDQHKRNQYGINWKGKKLRYYAAGEYGTARHRPHYHIIIFNIYDVNNVQKAWTNGAIHITECNANTIAYTLKYLQKDNSTYWWKVKKYDVQKEFSICSKHLGHNFLTEEMIKHYRKYPEKNYTVTDKGYKIPLSKYYREKIFTKEERQRNVGIIKRAVEKQEIKERFNIERLGANYDLLKVNAKFVRQTKLNKPLKNRDVD